MSEKDDDQPELLEKLFSTQVILTAILILGIYWVFLGKIKVVILLYQGTHPRTFQLESAINLILKQ